ncbi:MULTISPECIES: glycoside hydrolase family 11 protein [Sorangium]|uniref:glycoside hydrolase family 11 protein n=1 Tax=Sorangium TaxID=39643 RepID=UPI003D9C570F
MEYCSNRRGNAGNGYGYELWAEGGGSGCMTVHGVDATFSAEWNDVEDFLARVGLDFNQTQKHTQIGTISAEFAHTKTEEDGGFTYIGIYGWTVNPLREFYILDDWGSEKPGGFSSDGTPRDEVGTLTADGETYDVWKKTRVNKPAITGPSETFDQYFSIRRTARTCGTISVSEHFTRWEGLGLSLGNLHEIKLLLEAQFNSGTVKFTTAKFVVK